jgi:hypothetical protein
MRYISANCCIGHGASLSIYAAQNSAIDIPPKVTRRDAWPDASRLFS